MSLILRSSNTFEEVVSNGKTLYYKHNSTPGINIVCFNKLLNTSLNFNINTINDLINILKKIPKDFITGFVIHGNINDKLSPADIIFLKDKFITKLFDTPPKVHKHWCMLFYKSESETYNLLHETFNDDDITTLEIKVQDIIDASNVPNLVYQTPLDLLKKRITEMEGRNTFLENKMNEMSVSHSMLETQNVENTKKIEETYDIFNKLIDTMDDKITNVAGVTTNVIDVSNDTNVAKVV